MYETVTGIIQDYIGQEVELKPETNLVTDLGLSSFDVVSLIGEFEDAFAVDIPTEDIDKLETIKSLVDYIASLV